MSWRAAASSLRGGRTRCGAAAGSECPIPAALGWGGRWCPLPGRRARGWAPRVALGAGGDTRECVSPSHDAAGCAAAVGVWLGLVAGPVVHRVWGALWRAAPSSRYPSGEAEPGPAQPGWGTLWCARAMAVVAALTVPGRDELLPTLLALFVRGGVEHCPAALLLFTSESVHFAVSYL